MKQLRAAAVAVAVGCLLAGAVGGSATAAVDDETGVLEALEVTTDSAEAPDVLADVAAAGDAGVTLPESSADPVVVTNGGEEIAVHLPGAPASAEDIGAGLIGYDNGEGYTSVPVPKDDGSVQLISVIDGESSPTEYRYDFELPDGASLSPVEDGGVAVFAADGTVLYAVLAPWAVDANGAAVTTSYEIDGGSVIQHVAHDSSTAYPVVADPWLGGTWVQQWAWYSGAVRIALTPTTFAQYACPGNITCANTWQGAVQSELANAQPIAANKTKINKSTTRNQIGCHMVVGPLKSPWNLETSKADYGLAGFIATACNP
jgi:hypothetical protein